MAHAWRLPESQNGPVVAEGLLTPNMHVLYWLSYSWGGGSLLGEAIIGIVLRNSHPVVFVSINGRGPIQASKYFKASLLIKRTSNFGQTLGTAPFSNSWILIIIGLYIALNRTPNIDCYWVGAGHKENPKSNYLSGHVRCLDSQATGRHLAAVSWLVSNYHGSDGSRV